VALSVPEAQAQRKVGTVAAPFLTLGVGARATALGHAYTATARGGDALFWNPAGAAIRKDGTPLGSVFFSDHQWMLDIRSNSAALTLPLGGARVAGLSFTLLDYGRMDVTTLDQPYGTGERFRAPDMMIGFSYAQPLTDRFFIGGTTKYVRQSIWDMEASTFAVDIGFVLVTQYVNGMRLAAVMQNFGGRMQLDGINTQIFVDPVPENDENSEQVPARYQLEKWNLPISFKFGVAVPLVVTDFVRWEVMAESHQTNDQALNADVGTEVRLSAGSSNFNLRAGYRDLPLDEIDTHMVFGLGVDTGVQRFRFGADLAYVPFDVLGSATLIDLRFYF
jgi:hypothetical protein